MGTQCQDSWLKQPVDDCLTALSIHGGIIGLNLPAAGIETLLAANITPARFKETADNYSTKWWDYRRLAPGHSFMLFAHHYYRASSEIARKMLFEKRRDKKMLALVGAGVLQWSSDGIWEREKGHLSGLWNGMTVADQYGMPYDQFCTLTCRAALDNAWSRAPMPNQIYSPKLAAIAVNNWEDMSAKKVTLARHPMFKQENYVGAPVQDEYREWLVGQISKSERLVPTLASAVYQHRHLPEAIARAHFPDEAMKRAEILAS